VSIKASNYERFLAEYSNREAAIALLKQYRPYLEMLPSLRRPEKSIITIPLPLIRILAPKSVGETGFSATHWCQLKPKALLQQFSINLTTGINHQIKSRQGFCGLHT